MNLAVKERRLPCPSSFCESHCVEVNAAVYRLRTAGLDNVKEAAAETPRAWWGAVCWPGGPC